jgi:hypothetical protein
MFLPTRFSQCSTVIKMLQDLLPARFSQCSTVIKMLQDLLPTHELDLTNPLDLSSPELYKPKTTLSPYNLPRAEGYLPCQYRQAPHPPDASFL